MKCQENLGLLLLVLSLLLTLLQSGALVPAQLVGRVRYIMASPRALRLLRDLQSHPDNKVNGC
jgi:hypothetical protein